MEVERQDFRQVAVVKAFRHGADEILHLLTRVRDEEGSGGCTQFAILLPLAYFTHETSSV